MASGIFDLWSFPVTISAYGGSPMERFRKSAQLKRSHSSTEKQTVNNRLRPGAVKPKSPADGLETDIIGRSFLGISVFRPPFLDTFQFRLLFRIIEPPMITAPRSLSPPSVLPWLIPDILHRHRSTAPRFLIVVFFPDGLVGRLRRQTSLYLRTGFSLLWDFIFDRRRESASPKAPLVTRKLKVPGTDLFLDANKRCLYCSLMNRQTAMKMKTTTVMPVWLIVKPTVAAITARHSDQIRHFRPTHHARYSRGGPLCNPYQRRCWFCWHRRRLGVSLRLDLGPACHFTKLQLPTSPLEPFGRSSGVVNHAATQTAAFANRPFPGALCPIYLVGNLERR